MVVAYKKESQARSERAASSLLVPLFPLRGGANPYSGIDGQRQGTITRKNSEIKQGIYPIQLYAIKQKSNKIKEIRGNQT